MLQHPHLRQEDDTARPSRVAELRRKKDEPLRHDRKHAKTCTCCADADVETRIVVRLASDERSVNHDDGVVVVAHELARAFQRKEVGALGVPLIYNHCPMRKDLLLH